MTQEALERIWRRRADALVRRHNFAWWLERFNSLLLGGLLLVAILLLTGRTWGWPQISQGIVAASLAAWIAILAVAGWLLSRRHFIGGESGLVRLDERLFLNNRLVSAAARVGPWPEFPDGGGRAADFSWNAARVWLPGLGAVALVIAAWLAPLPRRAPAPAKGVEPGAWQQMEDWLAALEEAKVVEEKAIEEVESRIEELREQPEEDWFRHSSLEATDSLQESLGLEIRELAESLNRLERNLAALERVSPGADGAERESGQRSLEEALEAVAGSGLEMDEALRKQLGAIDPAKWGQETLAGLTAEQLRALQKQLREGSGTLGAMEGLPSLEGMEGEGLPGQGLATGETPGKGGISRGRADAPLFFGKKADELGTENLERVTNDDLSKASLGEVLGTGETEREIDESDAGPVAGGTIGSVGRGGEVTSRESLLPDEKAVLKRYFK